MALNVNEHRLQAIDNEVQSPERDEPTAEVYSYFEQIMIYFSTDCKSSTTRNLFFKAAEKRHNMVSNVRLQCGSFL